MEDQDLFVDPNYLKGFNGGYILAQQDPKLFAQLIKLDNGENSLFNGIKEGGKEYIKEKIKESLKSERDKNKGKGKDLDFDRS